MKKKILVLTFYYEPDLCAGSFRSSALVNELSKYNTHIHVISSLPNRYKSYKANKIESENKKNIKIFRISVPSHNSGFLDQAISFFYFYQNAKKIASRNEYDLIFATSSRLFTAFLGAKISKNKKIPLYLDIRDLFVDTLPNVISSWFSLILMPILRLIEDFTFSNASKINIVSKGFQSYFVEKYPETNLSFFTNGIDKEFIDCIQNKNNKKNINEPSLVLYAGNIGEGQGLHKIIPQIAERLKDRIHFKVIGDGNLLQKLKEVINNSDLKNVDLLAPVDRNTLIKEYLKSDVLFLHLNNYEAFKKVLPSKIFEYAAMNKPILAGIDGYSADFVKSHIENCEVFFPGDIEDAIIKFNKLNFNVERRKNFIKNYDRRQIMNKMAKDIYEL